MFGFIFGLLIGVFDGVFFAGFFYSLKNKNDAENNVEIVSAKHNNASKPKVVKNG